VLVSPSRLPPLRRARFRYLANPFLQVSAVLSRCVPGRDPIRFSPGVCSAARSSQNCCTSEVEWSDTPDVSGGGLSMASPFHLATLRKLPDPLVFLSGLRDDSEAFRRARTTWQRVNPACEPSETGLIESACVALRCWLERAVLA
jgi:hypothetical protein